MLYYTPISIFFNTLLVLLTQGQQTFSQCMAVHQPNIYITERTLIYFVIFIKSGFLPIDAYYNTLYSKELFLMRHSIVLLLFSVKENTPFFYIFLHL